MEYLSGLQTHRRLGRGLLQRSSLLAAPRLRVLVWRHDGLVWLSKTDSMPLIRTSELFVCHPRGKRNFFDASLVTPREGFDARQVGMPVFHVPPANRVVRPDNTIRKDSVAGPTVRMT